MNTAEKSMYEWNDINWRKLERKVFKLHSSDISSVGSNKYVVKFN